MELSVVDTLHDRLDSSLCLHLFKNALGLPWAKAGEAVVHLLCGSHPALLSCLPAQCASLQIVKLNCRQCQGAVHSLSAKDRGNLSYVLTFKDDFVASYKCSLSVPVFSL